LFPTAEIELVAKKRINKKMKKVKRDFIFFFFFLEKITFRCKMKMTEKKNCWSKSKILCDSLDVFFKA
jgi:hypothetical protein